MKRNAAIYLRISAADRLNDGTLDEAGVQRQLVDCERYCTSKGWKTTVYSENNRSASAYAKKRRKTFDAMLDAVKAGTHDTIVVAELSRYTREPRIVEDLIDSSAAGTVQLVSVNGGAYDVSTAEGKMRLRSEAMFAASYSDFVSDKVRRKHRELRERGLPHGVSRPFGYLGPDKQTGRRAGMEIERTEAAAIKKAVKDVLAGATLLSIAERWNAQGFRTPRKGALWGVSTVRIVLTNPRNAGLIATQRGRDGRRIRYEIVGEAAWPAIISRQDYERISALINDPDRRKKQPPRRRLLTGKVKCDCGGAMVSHGAGYLRCKALPDTNACGSNGIPLEPLEELIEDAIVYRLDTAKMWNAIDKKTRAQKKQRAAGDEDAEELRAELDALAAAVGDGLYSVREGLIIRKGLEERLDRAQAVATGDDSARVLEPFRQGNVAKVWAKLDLNAKRAVLDALIDVIEIARRPDSEKNTRGLWNPDRIDLSWRV